MESYSLPPPTDNGFQYPYTQTRRKRSSNPQQDENFIAALEAVRTGGLGFCKAAKIYGVNNRTLWLEYKKRGYPVMRPSTKMRSMNEQNMKRQREQNSLDHNNCLQKIKLPPLPCSQTQAQNTTQPCGALDYSAPLFNYSTL
jgi:hypothetical protein